MSSRNRRNQFDDLSTEQISYIKGSRILQIAVWRITHSDPLSAMHHKVSSYILREAIILLINIRERFVKIKLKMALQKWLKICKKMRGVNERRRVLLKLLVLGKDAKIKSILSKYILRWKKMLKVSEKEILEKYGALFKLIDYVKDASLRPIKKKFFQKLKAVKKPKILREPAKKFFKYYEKNLKDLMRKVLIEWRNRAYKLANKDLKRRVLRLATVSAINRAKQQAKLSALKKWYENTIDRNNRGYTLYLIYNKWVRYNNGNLLHAALLRWRLNTLGPNDMKQRILNAKKHMLKHNINKNAEDLLNAMRTIHDFDKRANLLRKILKKIIQKQDDILRDKLRKWNDNAKKLAALEKLRNLRLKHIIDLNEFKKKLALLRALNVWRRHIVPGDVLADTEKACKHLRKATISPFFNKLREKMRREEKRTRFEEIMRKFFQNRDKDLLHWYLGEWRNRARRLMINNFKAIIIKASISSNEEKDKLRAIYKIKERAKDNKYKLEMQRKILKFILNKYDELGDTKLKGKLASAFYRWKANVGHFKSPYEIIKPYKDGAEILQRFCWRITHPDILDAFYDKITTEEIKKKLLKLIIDLDKNYVKDLLRKYFNRWRNNIKCRPGAEKLREMFDKYLLTEKIRSKLMEPYRDIVNAMAKWYNKKLKASRKINDFVKKIKDIPEQLHKMKITTMLAKLILKHDKYLNLLKATLKEWRRRARVIKADEDDKIIQKFIREHLNRRVELKKNVQKVVKFTEKNILRDIFNKLKNAKRNKLPELLMKLFLKKDADNLKKLREKFNHWRNLIPYLRRKDAAIYIQSVYRGYRVRKDLDNDRRLKYLLRKILGKYLERNNLDSAWQKWKKNDKLVQCDKNSRIIQEFLRTQVCNNLKNQAQNNLSDLFKKLFIKKIKFAVEQASKIDLDAADNLYHTLIRVACREPFYKLMKGLKWKIIMDRFKIIPDILDRKKENILKKYLDKWYENGFIIPNKAAMKIQAAYRGYLARKGKNKNKRLKDLLVKLVKKYILSDEDLLQSTLMKWRKNARLVKCDEDSKIIQEFCNEIKNKLRRMALLKKLIPMRQKFIENILRNKLRKWLENAKKLKDIDDRLYDLLIKMISKYGNNLKDLLRHYLLKWKKIAYEKSKLAAAKRIAKYFENRYKIAKARKNWKKLSDKLRHAILGNETKEILKELKKVKAFDDLYDSIDKKIKKDGINQLKQGNKWLKLLGILNKIFDNQFWKNRENILRKYLYKWEENTRKLQLRDEALDRALEEINKRILVSNVDIMSDAMCSEKIIRSVPLARTKDFLEKLKNKYKLWKILYRKLLKLLRKYIDNGEDLKKNLLRKKLRQWLKNALKKQQENAKSRIARWIENRYRIANARKNWKKLVDKYDLYKNNGDLNYIRKKLKNYALLKSLTKKLRNKFEKTGKDQFDNGVKHFKLLLFLRKLFDNWDKRNRILLLRNYLNKWDEKAQKLKLRDEILNDALEKINRKNIINNINTIKNASISKKITSATPVARTYDFLNKFKDIAFRNRYYKKLRRDLIHSKEDINNKYKQILMTKLYKIYYYKIIDNLFNKLKKIQDDYKKKHIKNFLELLSFYALLSKCGISQKTTSKDLEPNTINLKFKGKRHKKTHKPQDKSVVKMILPSLVKFLNDKFLSQKKWANDKILNYYRSKKFADLYKKWSNKTIIPPKRDLVDLIKAEYLYMNGLGASNCDLFKLLRKYWVKHVCDVLSYPSRVYKILYLIKMVMMHKAIAYQRFIREIIRKWRFAAFITNLSKRKLELMYKNLHVSYLQMANEIFGDKGPKNASVIKEFERLSTKMGTFTNEDYNYPNEENYCEKITKKYVFQSMQNLVDKENPSSNFFSSGIEVEDSGINNQDFYVDQDLVGDTIGKFKQNTSNSGMFKNDSKSTNYEKSKEKKDKDKEKKDKEKEEVRFERFRKWQKIH